MLSDLKRGPQWTIANGAALSNAIDLDELGIVAIIMPAAWTAASLTFQGAESESGTYNDVYDSSGTELTVAAAASRHIMLSPLAFAGLRYLKLRSGTTGTPVNQGAARTVVPLTRGLA